MNEEVSPPGLCLLEVLIEPFGGFFGYASRLQFFAFDVCPVEANEVDACIVERPANGTKVFGKGTVAMDVGGKIPFLGVDADDVMIAHCMEHGHGKAIGILPDLMKGPVGIFNSHIAEIPCDKAELNPVAEGGNLFVPLLGNGSAAIVMGVGGMGKSQRQCLLLRSEAEVDGLTLNVCNPVPPGCGGPGLTRPADTDCSRPPTGEDGVGDEGQGVDAIPIGLDVLDAIGYGNARETGLPFVEPAVVIFVEEDFSPKGLLGGRDRMESKEDCD